MASVTALLSSLVSPVAKIFEKRQDRKIARETAQAKLKQAKHEGTQQLQLGDQELEVILAAGLEGSWKDEYVTLSFVSIINLIVLGGVLSAFGYPQVLQGVSIAATTLVAVGVELGFLMTAVVMSAIGLSIWRKV